MYHSFNPHRIEYYIGGFELFKTLSQTGLEGERVLDIKNLALRVAQAAWDVRAHDIKILDMRSVSIMTDYFVIVSGDSMVHVRAVVGAILDEVKDDDLKIKRREGSDDARWVLIDLGDVIAHVFHHAEREFYDLDNLWSDAGEIPWENT